MAVRKTWMAVAAALLAAGLVMTGCPTGGGDDPDSPGTPGVGGLEDLGGDKTGLATVKEPGVLLQPGEDMTPESVVALDITDPSYLGGGVKSWSVKKGKLSFELEAPDSDSLSQTISDLLDDGYFGGYDYDAGAIIDPKWKVTVTGDTAAKVTTVRDFYDYDDGSSYSISRSTDESGATYFKGSGIEYVYVTGDVTLKRDEVKDKGSGSDEGGDYSWNGTYKAFTLELKKGWNLLQTNSSTNGNPSNYNYTMECKIADKDVPWTVDTWSNGSDRKADGRHLTKRF